MIFSKEKGSFNFKLWHPFLNYQEQDIRMSCSGFDKSSTSIISKFSRNVIEKSLALIPISAVRVQVGAYSIKTKDWDLEGIFVEPNQIYISLYSSSDMNRLLVGNSYVEDYYKYTLSHELYHSTRSKLVTSKTLFDYLVTEGLADHFGDIFSDSRFRVKIDTTVLDKMRKRILPELDLVNPTLAHYDAWFSERLKGEIVPKSGYAIGYNMVSRYLLDHPRENAATLVHAPSEIFREYV